MSKFMNRKKPIMSYTNSEPTIKVSITKLMAKSPDQGNLSLLNHSLEAARMILTLSEHIVPIGNSERIRRCSFISGLFHDIGKAATGFQLMLQKKNIIRWPEDSGGNRHEILSVVILLTNLGILNKWKDNPSDLSAIYLAIITHHKPFRQELSTYPKIIPSNQWFQESQFKQSHFKEMYDELYENKSLIHDMWQRIISEISKDNWGNKLITDGWLPNKLIFQPPDIVVDRLMEIYPLIKIRGYRYGFIDKKEFIKNNNKNYIQFLSTIRTLTTVGDHLSSGRNFYVPPIPKISKYDIFEDKNTEPREFQQKCGDTVGNIMLRAPTGSGKTEAAYKWIAKNQSRIINDTTVHGKIFFVLPFQASLNAMYKRLNKWLNVKEGQLVGLQHSRSANSLFAIISDEIKDKLSDEIKDNSSDEIKDNSSNEIKDNSSDDSHIVYKIVRDFENPWENDQIKAVELDKFSNLLFTREIALKYVKKERTNKSNESYKSKISRNLANLAREIFYPVKVTTPHQILKGILQGRGWEITVHDLNHSTIVFDEIHVYNPHLTGMILSMAKLLHESFNAKIMFMSASFPSFLIKKINQTMGYTIPLVELDETIESDRIVLEKKRHKILIKNYSVSEIIKTAELMNKIESSKSTLIICNTVSTAQNVYLYLKDKIIPKYGSESIMLFHSRFKICDRNNKEKLISQINSINNKLKVIVATQVIEVSLDIDLEFGIFESAPLDALTQRFGRVNRKGERNIENHNIWLCKQEGYSYLIYNNNLTDYSTELLRTVEHTKISETKLVELIDKLYKKYPWDETQEKQFDMAFKYTKIMDYYKHILPGSYRYWIDDIIDGQTSIDIILKEDKQKYRKLKYKSALSAHQLIIPVRVKKNDIMQNKKDPPILIVDYEYNSELGLILKKGEK